MYGVKKGQMQVELVACYSQLGEEGEEEEMYIHKISPFQIPFNLLVYEKYGYNHIQKQACIQGHNSSSSSVHTQKHSYHLLSFVVLKMLLFCVCAWYEDPLPMLKSGIVVEDAPM